MLCPECGETLEDGCTVCPSCGATINAEDSATQADDSAEEQRPLDEDATAAMESLDTEATVVDDEGGEQDAQPTAQIPVEQATEVIEPVVPAIEQTASMEPVEAEQETAPMEPVAPAQEAAAAPEPPTGQVSYAAPVAPVANAQKQNKHPRSQTPGTDRFCGIIVLLLFLATALAGGIVLFLSFASGDYLNYTLFLAAATAIGNLDPSVSYVTVILIVDFIAQVAFWLFWLVTVFAQLIGSVRLLNSSRKRYRSSSVALVLTMILAAFAPIVLIGLSGLPSNLDAALILPMGASTVIGLLLPCAQFVISLIFIFIIKHLAHRKKEHDEAMAAQARV